jgi:hypothetical protein
MAGKRPVDDTALSNILRSAQEFNRSQGVLTWGDEALAQVDDFRPPSLEHPRLFISYRWGDYELESWLDMLIGSLVVRGYRVVYDRDPRNFEAQLSRDAVLQRMDRCNYYVAVLNGDFEKRVQSRDLAATSALSHEWEHAMARARHGNLRITAIWFSGESLSPPFDAATVIDLRLLHTENHWREQDRFFPDLRVQGSRFDPPVVPSARLPVPELLHRSGGLIQDQYRRVTICAWKPDGTCDRLGPYLIRQLERVAAQLRETGRYTHITTEPAGAADDDGDD